MHDKYYISNLVAAFATTVSSQVEQQVAELGGRSLNHEAALVTIYNHSLETIDVLSKVLGLTHSGAVRLINTLEKEGLVKRLKSKKDARAVVLCVTKKGQQRVQKVLEAREQATAQVLASFNEEQRENLLQLLEIAMGGLTNEKVEARRICRLCNEGVCRTIGCPVERAVVENRSQ